MDACNSMVGRMQWCDAWRSELKWMHGIQWWDACTSETDHGLNPSPSLTQKPHLPAPPPCHHHHNLLCMACTTNTLTWITILAPSRPLTTRQSPSLPRWAHLGAEVGSMPTRGSENRPILCSVTCWSDTRTQLEWHGHSVGVARPLCWSDTGTLLE